MATIACPNPTNLSGAYPAMPGGAILVTPADADVFQVPVHIRVGGAGNVAVVPANNGPSGASIVYPLALAGEILPFRVWAVLSTGTTATQLTAIY